MPQDYRSSNATIPIIAPISIPLVIRVVKIPPLAATGVGEVVEATNEVEWLNDTDEVEVEGEGVGESVILIVDTEDVMLIAIEAAQ